jgi:hypothetical protein
MLDREPCKNGEWLSDIGNVDVSAVSLRRQYERNVTYLERIREFYYRDVSFVTKDVIRYLSRS